MEDVWSWTTARWAEFETWAGQPPTNGLLLVVAFLLAVQINGAANRVAEAIWLLHSDLMDRLRRPDADL